ncbi:Zinc finger CCCH domain-containing protein 17 [Bienertia sinuspersici]
MASTVTKEPVQQQQGPSSSLTAEDESLKRNTDCVYFLASPLTCKKGSECEYRHSEYARMNPRDCYYWLNGNCLNPKCGFRHPPLDGLVAPQAGNFDGSSAPVVPVPFVPSAPQNLPKQGVPCIFFQKGFCLKGDKCPFMHGPNSSSTKSQQVPASTAVPESPFKKTFGSLEKCSQLKTNVQTNKQKLEAPPQANVIPKAQSARPTNGVLAGKGYPHASGVTGEAPRYEEMRPYGDNGNSRSRSGRAHHGVLSDDQIFHNGRDADDSLRESSPGFDVLVDDKLSEDEYYHNEDQYVRMRGNDGRNLKEFDMGHQDSYNSVADVDRDNYHNRRGYDSFDRLPDKYARDHRRASSERSLGEPAPFDRRVPYKSKSPDLNQNSDLRHRLLKHRRVNGLKSVVNSDYTLDDHADDRSYRSSRRDSRRSPIHESSRGNRLQGRIKLPRTSPMGGNDKYSERESERGRSWGRLSPSRQLAPGQQSRLRDRLSGRIRDESHEERKIKDPVLRRDSAPSNGANFAGPKSLSELRGTKQTDSKQQQQQQQQQQQLKSQQSVSAGKLRDTVLVSSRGTEGDVAFEGPKPLSEILKRKRTTSSGVADSYNKDEMKQHENDVNLTSMASNFASDTGKQAVLSSAAEQTKASEEENKPLVDEEEGEILNKKIKLNGEDESSLSKDNKDPEAEEEALVVADVEEPVFDDEYDQGDGEYDYEQDDGEEFHLNEGENGDHEEEFMDEDDGDDFAKKLGVSF